MPLLDKRRDVDDEAGAHVGVETGVDDFERPMRIPTPGSRNRFLGTPDFRPRVDFFEAREETGVVTQCPCDGVIGMASLPVGKNDDARAKPAEDADHGDAILKRVLNGAVGQGERLPPSHAQNARGFFGLAGALLGRAAGSGFALGEIENGSAQAARRHAQQCAAAGLLHVVAMRGDSQDVGAEVDGVNGHVGYPTTF